MAEADKLFAGSIPEIYDRHLGPLIFEPYARDLAGRMAGTGGLIVETAAGTGVLTRALVEAVAPDATVTATDLNQPMLDHAAQQLVAPRLSWRQADALRLPFEDGDVDVVVCQFGAMFFPDKVAGYREARRVLRPGGRFLFSVWDRLEENEITAAVHEAVADLFPDDPPSFLARAPHGYHDAARIREDLRAAGFEHVALETVTFRGRAPSAADPAIGFCQGCPLRHEIEGRDAGRLDEVTGLVTGEVARRFGRGPIEGRLQAHVITARA